MLITLLRLGYFVVACIDFLLILIVMLFCVVLPAKKRKWILRPLARQLQWAFLYCLGVRYHLHEWFSGALPRQYILITNHVSSCEVLLLSAYFPVISLVWHEVSDLLWPVGHLAREHGAVFVDRERIGSRAVAVRRLLACTRQGENVMICPEGACNEQINAFKKGAFFISMRTGIPVLPVYVHYEAKHAFFWGKFGYIKHIYKMMTSNNKRLHCHVCDPIYPTEFTDSADFAQHVHRRYQKWEAAIRFDDCSNRELPPC